MYWHTRVWRENEPAGRGKTEKIELPENVPIGSIILHGTAKKTAANPMAALAKWRLLDYIGDISVIGDGRTVVKHVPASVITAMTLYDQGVLPPHQFREYSQDTDRVVLLLNFGRYLHDPEMYLPANKFDSLELRVENLATSTYFQQDIGLDILTIQPAGAGVPASKGFMRTETYRSWNTVNDERKHVKLPTKLPIRRIMLQAIPPLDDDEIEKTNLFNLMYDIKITFKSGDVEFYNGDLEWLIHKNVLETGLMPMTNGWIYHTADKGFNVGLGYVQSMAGLAGSDDGAASAVIPTVQRDRSSRTQKPETYEANNPYAWLAIGLAPEGVVLIPFDYLPDPTTWLDPAVQKDVDLEIHTRDMGDNYAEVTDGINRVILDRLDK
ncbi:MAG: hypothetical protein HWN68_11805 [Desulfobacterales bacterium]|nr:hypothetical protein [Desulfobacterales bacterium]